MELQTVISIVVPSVMVIAWLVRQEGRITGHDREIGDVKDDVKYIRQRIDSAINGRRRE